MLKNSFDVIYDNLFCLFTSEKIEPLRNYAEDFRNFRTQMIVELELLCASRVNSLVGEEIKNCAESARQHNQLTWTESYLLSSRKRRRRLEVRQGVIFQRKKHVKLQEFSLTKRKIFCCNFSTELYLGSALMETFEVPSSIDFVRNHVAKNLPLVIRGALADSAAVKKWNSQHFR